jgi:hypothetical protein
MVSFIIDFDYCVLNSDLRYKVMNSFRKSGDSSVTVSITFSV